MIARRLMIASALAGVFLAFGWPLFVSADPASETFHIAAIATLVAFFVCTVAALATRR